jgi:septation ring formation regulator EzrA
MAGGESKEQFAEEMEEQLDTLWARFQAMELEQMRKGEIEARAKLARAKKQVKKRRREVERRLDAVRDSRAGAWEEAGEDAREAWAELEEQVERAQRDFEGTLEEEEEEAEASTG